MRILFYISAIAQGGAARVMTNLANQFSADNEVLFVTNFRSDQEYFLCDAVRRVSIECEESRDGFFVKNARRIMKLRAFAKNFRADVIISFMYENDVRAYFAKIGLKTKVILSVRIEPCVRYNRQPKKMIAKFIYRHADGAVFQTEMAENFFVPVKGRSRVIKNQVDKQFFDIVYDIEKAKDIVTAGRITEQKNHILLLKAFEQIKDKINDDLYIYGEGELRSDCEKYVKEHQLEQRVFLPGNVSNMPQILAKSKLFVMTSDYEGVPNALIEALAVGVPCIATDCIGGGSRELLCGKLREMLVPVRDMDCLTEKMLKILSDKNLASAMSMEAKKRALAFTPEKTFEEWNAFINEVAGNER